MSLKEFEEYNKHEESYWWYVGRRSILKSLLSFIPAESRKSLIEIGCGTGGNLIHLFNEFPSRTGIELDSDAIKFARSKLGNSCELIQMDANSLNQLNKQHDCLALLDVLYHKNIPNPESFLTNCSKVIKPGGYILFSDGAFNFLAGEHSRSVGSVRRFTSFKLKQLLHQSGFEIVHISYWGVLLFFLMFTKRCILEPLLKLFKQPSESYQSDFISIPVFDFLMLKSLQFESFLIRMFGLPFGASIAVLARKRIN